MNREHEQSGPGSGRVQWGSYGFLAGLVVGVLAGWFFAGFIGALIRVGLVALVVVPVVVTFLAWRKYVGPWLRPPAQQTYIVPTGAIETSAVVHGNGRQPQPR